MATIQRESLKMAPRALVSREQRATEHGDEDTLGISASALASQPRAES